MKIIRLIVTDIRKGLILLCGWGVFSGVLFLLFNMALYRSLTLYGEQVVSLTLGDYFINTFAGIPGYVINPYSVTALPFLWFCATITILYITLDYPSEDLAGIGKHLLALSGGRMRWWVSKCVWVFIVVLLYFFIWLVVAAVWVFATQGELSLAVSFKVAEVLNVDPAVLKEGPWAIERFYLGSFLAIVALCYLQLFISLCIKSRLAFMASVSLLFMSFYFMNPLLLGNHLMAARSDVFVTAGVDWLMGVFLSIWIIVAVIFFGGWFFSRMDIVARED